MILKLGDFKYEVTFWLAVNCGECINAKMESSSCESSKSMRLAMHGDVRQMHGTIVLIGVRYPA
jgi:hypothetical protein